jgi:hypothetical protein
VRYNAERDSYCPVDSSTGANSWAPATVTTIPPQDSSSTAGEGLKLLGRRECIRRDSRLATPEPADISTNPMASCKGYSQIDSDMHDLTGGGFKIFVNLRRYNPVLQDLANRVDSTGRIAAREDCPWFLASENASGRAAYDFQQAGDMIKVTVTGMIDTNIVKAYADITSASPRKQQLFCQISDVVRPYSQTARYWMQGNGEIYRWIGTGGGSGSTTDHQVFAATASPANRGFSVSPDNRWIFILQEGRIKRYGECRGEPPNCPTSGVVEWTVPVPGLTALAGKYVPFSAGSYTAPSHLPFAVCGTPQDGLPVLFALRGSDRKVFCITLPSGGGTVNLFNDGQPTTVTRIPFLVPPSARVRSIIMDHRATSAYAIDLSGSNTLTGGGSTVYHGGIYSTNDREMSYPLEVFSVRGIAFSK